VTDDQIKGLSAEQLELLSPGFVKWLEEKQKGILKKIFDSYGRPIFLSLLALALIALIITLLVVLSDLPPGDVAGWTQVVIELFLIPITIIGLWYAFREFSEYQKRSIIDIATYSEYYHEALIKIPTEGSSSNLVTLTLDNRGEAVERWWSLSISIPKSLFKTLDNIKSIWTDFVDGLDVAFFDTKDHITLRISSHGQVAIFDILELGTIEITTYYDHSYETYIDVPYHIIYEKGPTIRGNKSWKFSRNVTWEPRGRPRRIG